MKERDQIGKLFCDGHHVLVVRNHSPKSLLDLLGIQSHQGHEIRPVLLDLVETPENEILAERPEFFGNIRFELYSVYLQFPDCIFETLIQFPPEKRRMFFEYPRLFATERTSCFFSSLMFGRLLRARSTVPMDTPAAFAIALIVTFVSKVSAFPVVIVNNWTGIVNGFVVS
jgi:hypothetical protein